MNRLPVSLVCLMLTALIATPSPSGGQAAEESRDDEQTLQSAGLSSNGPALLAFFHARSRVDVDPNRLRVLLEQLASSSNPERSLATAEFLGFGPLAVPTLRRAANTLENPELARRAAHCLRWLEGSASTSLPVAAASVLGQRKPAGAAGALLAYLPFADSPEVLRAVTAALAAVAVPNGKPDPALLRGLTDPMAVRRAAAGIALARAAPPEEVPVVRKLLKDPALGVRLRTAMALAEARDAEAIPVLIDLLAELPVDQRKQVEELLQQLAGEWAPAAHFTGEDEIARKIRRDAWAAWWRNTDGNALLSALRKRTLTAEDRDKVRDLIAKLSSDDFSMREAASRRLSALGRRSLPQLREAARSKDAETARRAKMLIEQIEEDPAHRLPAAAIRLLAVRKPAGSVEALLAFLPHVDDESVTEEVQKSLGWLALQNGKPAPALMSALSDTRPRIRAVAAEALINGCGTAGRAAVRQMLKDQAAAVRLRVALALAKAREKDGVPVLIDLLIQLPGEQVGEVEDALYQLAGDTAPEVSLGTEKAEKKKCRDAWAAWWKVNANRVDLGRLTTRLWYGYTLICDCSNNRVYELDRKGKERWAIEGVQFPVDAWVVPGNRVLIAEYNGNKVTERDFKGRILWTKEGLPSQPVNVQRLLSGNTFIATSTHILEVDRTGKEVYSFTNVPGGITAAYRARNGNIICLANNGSQCLIMDTTGKTLKQFGSNRNGGWTSGIDLLSNGRILITQPDRNKVTEYDSDGKSIVEVDAPMATTATVLPNGHFLVASHQAQRVFEVDRGGKVVWEHKGNGNIFRARRR
ncbi:MAG TPA: HEAT repeat domain-containing protein [Gemmataceae bacterium]|nr:HEAT repeat domain-containing protein [Gemmataceae bacterium]